MEALDKDTERHTTEWLHAGQEKLKVAAQHLLTAREDAAKKLGLDRDEAKKAEQGRNKRAK
jgi:peptidyl-tRNA hydrolase